LRDRQLGIIVEDFLAFWGKASGAVEGGPPFHSAAYHNRDVAAAADALLLANSRRLLHMSHLLGTLPENAHRTLPPACAPPSPELHPGLS
jgi:HD domain